MDARTEPDANDLTDAELDAIAKTLIGTDFDPWDVMGWLGLTCDWDDKELRRKLRKGIRLRKATAQQCKYCERWSRGRCACQKPDLLCDFCKKQSRSPCKCPDAKLARKTRPPKQCKEIAPPKVSNGFNYVKFEHRGEHLATIHLIPRVWEDDDADFKCWCAIHRWIHHGSRDAFWDVFVASLPWLPIIAKSANGKLDKGDALIVCTGAAFDAIVKLRGVPHGLPMPGLKLHVPMWGKSKDYDWHDPTNDGDDGVEFHSLDQKFLAKVKGNYRCAKYVRFVQDEAQRALNRYRRELLKESEFGWLQFRLRYSSKHEPCAAVQDGCRAAAQWTRNGSDDWLYVDGSYLSDPERQLYECELFELAKIRLSKADPRTQTIVGLKASNHDMTTEQIGQHKDVQRHSTTVGRHLDDQLKDFATWLEVKPRKNETVKYKRATGDELPAERWCATLGDHCDVPTGLTEAKKKYEFDDSQFKIHQPRPTLLSQPVLLKGDESLGLVS